MPLTVPQIWKACYTSIESRPTTVMLTHHATQFNIHHMHFHDIAHLCLPHQDDISYHQSEDIALTMASHPTTQPLALRQSVLNSLYMSSAIVITIHCPSPHKVSWPQAIVFVSNICHPPLHSTHYITAYLVKLSVLLVLFPKLTVNFNPSCAVFQVHAMNQCPLICASSSWLHDEKVGASFKTN